MVIPFQVTGKDTEIVAVPLVAFLGPSKGYSTVPKNGIGLNDIRISFTFSAVTENTFSPSGK